MSRWRNRLHATEPGAPRDGITHIAEMRSRLHHVGQHRGRDLGFPTANLCSENELIPPRGVYATTVTLDGVTFPAMTNIGTRPTFEEAEDTVIETHVLDFDRDLYGAKLKLGFVQRLRDEKRFENIDALKQQIAHDRGQAQSLFDRMGL